MQAKKIAVIGAGAIGCYYGGRLAEAGHDVHFLMRRDYDAVRANGLSFTSPDGDFALPAPPIATSSDAIGPVDWVLCALKATSLDLVPALVGPCLGEHTRILLLMNGLGLEERFAQWFGAQRLFAGMAFTCVNRAQPGYVHHLAFGAVTIGHMGDQPDEIAGATGLWDGSKVEIQGAGSMLRARWEKLAWNIPFNGLTVTAGGVPTDRIVGDPALRAAARATMEEVIAAGNADLEAHGQPTRIDGPPLVQRMFALTDGVGAYRPSTMIDFVEGRSMEVESIFGEPLRRAEALGVDVPNLAMLTALMRALDRRSA